MAGQLGLRRARVVAVGGLRQRVAVRLELLVAGWGRPLGAGGASEKPQGSPANQGEPVELGRHEQRCAEVTVPGHRQRDHVEGDGSVPAHRRRRRQRRWPDAMTHECLTLGSVRQQKGQGNIPSIGVVEVREE